MKTLLIKTLETILRALVGALNYERVRTLVDGMNASDLSGPEKREIVLTEARTIAGVVGTALLNLAIEVAVTALKNRHG